MNIYDIYMNMYDLYMNIYKSERYFYLCYELVRIFMN